MHRLARTLLEKEVLDGDEVLQIIAEEIGHRHLEAAQDRSAEAADPAGRRRPRSSDGTIGPLVPEPA